jgi:hypothetical protein
MLDSGTLEAMRAPPDRLDELGNDPDSDDDITVVDSGPIGAYPGTHDQYRTATPNYF